MKLLRMYFSKWCLLKYITEVSRETSETEEEVDELISECIKNFFTY